jgi:hypothetical protein
MIERRAFQMPLDIDNPASSTSNPIGSYVHDACFHEKLYLDISPSSDILLRCGSSANDHRFECEGSPLDASNRSQGTLAEGPKVSVLQAPG